MALTKLEPRVWQNILVKILDMQEEECYYQKLLHRIKASNSMVWNAINLLEEKGMIKRTPTGRRIKVIILTRPGYALALSLKTADNVMKQGKIPDWLEPVIENTMKLSKRGGKSEV